VQYGDRKDLTVDTKPQTKGPQGTLPAGSVWREIPIPDSQMVSSGNFKSGPNAHGRCTWDAIKPESFSSGEARTKFEAGFGKQGTCDTGPDNHLLKNWHIKDKVRVPQHIEAGEYLMSWRWECGVADQVWVNCADVKVTDGSGSPAPRPSPRPDPEPEPETQPEPETEPESEGPLPAWSLPKWAGGTQLECQHFAQMGQDFCAHSKIRGSCRHCHSKSEPEPEPEHEQGTCDDIVGDVAGALPTAFFPAWAGGEQIDCLHLSRMGKDRCTKKKLKKACCFCGGGIRRQVEPEPEPEEPEPEEPEPEPETCLGDGDKVTLPAGQFQGYICKNYKDFKPNDVYCAHKQVAACCWCKDLELLTSNSIISNNTWSE